MRISDWSSDVCSSDLLESDHSEHGRSKGDEDMCAQARRLLSEFAIDTDGCAEHDGERQPADDLGQRYPGAEQVEEEIFQHPAEPWRPIATPEQSTPGSSDGSWTCIAEIGRAWCRERVCPSV